MNNKLNVTRVFMAVVGLGLVFLSSCTKLAKNLQYDLDLQMASMTVDIPPTPVTDSSIVGSQVNYYNVDSFIKANTANVLGVSNITSAKITSCVITLDSSANADNNFANFQSCSGSLSSNNKTTPYTLTIPNNPDSMATTLTMPVDTATDLHEYLQGTQFQYSLSGKLRRATTKNLKATVQLQFKVHVQG